MNFDPNMMNPEMMKNVMESFSQMSDDQLSSMMSGMGINIDPKTLRQFAGQFKDAKNEDFENLKNQYAEGNINMNDFMHQSPEFSKLDSLAKNAADLFKENKLADSAEVYSDIIKQFEELPAEVKAQNPEFSENFLLDIREKLSECKFKLEDLDSAIEEALKVLEKRPVYNLYLHVGISFFKKGKYYKARDNLLKAKELFTGEPEKILANYLKQTSDMIEDIES